MPRRRFVLDGTTRAIITRQVILNLHNKSITGTPILHVEASFISVERGLRRGILSRTSLILHLVLVHSKLIIFIYKQLKRPVAFSVVHNKVAVAKKVRCTK